MASQALGDRDADGWLPPTDEVPQISSIAIDGHLTGAATAFR